MGAACGDRGALPLGLAEGAVRRVPVGGERREERLGARLSIAPHGGRCSASRLISSRARIARGGEGAKKGSRAEERHRVAVTSAVVAGLVLGRLWANAGVEYFSNVLNWMQNASLLMLIGGLRGVVTRLTLWLALLGGSIATAKGKHINIDVVMRFLTPKMRIPVAISVGSRQPSCASPAHGASSITSASRSST